MKILVITRNAWDDTNAIGNTLSNFFNGVENIEFAAMYFRRAMPDNLLCKRYYRATEIDILRNWFRPSRIGKEFCLPENVRECNKAASCAKTANEKRLIRIIQRYGIKFAYKLSDQLWGSEKWINESLDEFITSFAPDLMVTFVKSAPQYYLTVRYLREKYRIPLFSWIADDEYTELFRQNAHEKIEKLRYILKESAVVCGCSEELCEYYNSIFGCHAKPLYKSCNLSEPAIDLENEVTTLVYAGNLLYGRLDVIRSIANVVEELSRNNKKIVFEIYSNTALLPDEEQKLFGTNSAVRYMGRRDYAFIKQRLALADIVVHVESFEKQQILKTRYSFSTKIMDYLQSGSMIFAVGPSEQASMSYIAKIPGTCVVSRLENLQSSLTDLLDHPESFSARAAEIRNFALKYHSSEIATENMNQILRMTIMGET